jgi:hypothetical protein
MEGGGLHRERPRGGGESGAWQCSTELLLVLRLKMIETVSWLGCGAGCWAGLVFGQMGCGQVSASLYFFLLIHFFLLLLFCFATSNPN